MFSLDYLSRLNRKIGYFTWGSDGTQQFRRYWRWRSSNSSKWYAPQHDSAASQLTLAADSL